MDFKPKNQEELLAWDMAVALNDYDHLPLYISYANKYPRAQLRKILGEVLEVPATRIRKSRAALFNHLVQKYAKENPGY